MRQLTHGSLFAGIGGFDLGFERAGIKTVWQVEIDPFCRKVLEKHWPHVKRFSDIREYGERFILERPDVISGGFPCQDISEAGKRVGIDGERSGLWSDYLRIVRQLRPRFVVVENVTALLNRGIERVLGDLALIWYDAEWEVIGADAFGASQHRERIWILAYPDDTRLQRPIWAGQSNPPRTEWSSAHSEPLRSTCGYWPPGPSALNDIPGMVDGPANRAHRLKALGNAVVPQIAEWIGRRIVAACEDFPQEARK